MKKNRKQIVVGIIFVISIMIAIGFITFFGKDEKGHYTEQNETVNEKKEEKQMAELGKKKSDTKDKEAKKPVKDQLKKEEKKEEKSSKTKMVETTTEKITETTTKKTVEKTTEKVVERNPSKEDTGYKEDKKTEKENEEKKTESSGNNNSKQEVSSGHVHDFKPVYETIHHDEEGYTERTHIQPWDEYVYEWHYYCTKCGYDLTVNCGGATNSAGLAHLETHENGSSYQLKESDVVKEVIHHEERVEEEYIVTKEAYDEVVLVYYQCSCGEIKLE